MPRHYKFYWYVAIIVAKVIACYTCVYNLVCLPILDIVMNFNLRLMIAFVCTLSHLQSACEAIGIEREFACYFGIFIECSKKTEDDWKRWLML